MNSSLKTIGEQWNDPADVSTILMVIGGDIVQSAFAQGTGKPYTPVCFSFGCVAYAIIALVNIIGEGRLLPRPDYPTKVFNLNSGYSRENRNWVIGRLLRDIETDRLRAEPEAVPAGIRIHVFDTLPNNKGRTQFSWCITHVIGAIATALQLLIATIPIALHGQWGIMLITTAGTILVQITGLLPQWTAEKLPHRQDSKTNFALTTGNGSRNIIVIRGNGHCLNLEEMSAMQPPRVCQPWEKFRPDPGTSEDGWLIKTFYGLPLGFRLTQINCFVQSVLWLILLINVAACENTWYLLGVGTLGMFQNAWLAGVEIPAGERNMQIKHDKTIVGYKVMDGIMDFEVAYGGGQALVKEFFPGNLRFDETEWWAGNRRPYDEMREREARKRGWPLSQMVGPSTPTTMPALQRNYTSPEQCLRATHAASSKTSFTRVDSEGRVYPLIVEMQEKQGG